MSNSIYIITCIEERDHHRKHTAEWHSTLEVATAAVEHNSGGMSEGATNHWAVIESVNEGSICINNEWWFEWRGDYESGGYRACSKPEWSEGVCNWWN